MLIYDVGPWGVVSSRRGSCRTGCGSASSRCCPSQRRGIRGIRVGRGSRIGRCCVGSCSCCTRVSTPRTCGRSPWPKAVRARWTALVRARSTTSWPRVPVSRCRSRWPAATAM